MSTSFRPSQAVRTRLSAGRANNLRQLLLRSSRVLNTGIVDGLLRRGYDVRSTHTALLSNLDASGNTVSKVAALAGMTKQAMGRIARELEDTGYITIVGDDADKRSRVLHFTPRGWGLMLESFEVLETIERRYATRIGQANLEDLRSALKAFLSAAETDSEPLGD